MTISLESWWRLRDVLVEEEGEFIYRGMHSAAWRPLTSLDRLSDEAGVSDRRALGRHLASSFERRSRARGLNSATTPIEGLALGQHWGLPTPLLDWTLSPYVAAMFAFAPWAGSASAAAEDVAIWRLDISGDAFKPALADDPNRSEIELVNVADHLIPRLFHQRGLFTLNNGSDDLLDALGRLGLLDRISCLSVPARDAELALRDLALMAIDFGTLFPDLEGAVRGSVQDARSALGRM